MSALRIDPEIANLCRPLTESEKAQLEANLLADGCREPLAVWGEILLDGHNRHEICNRRGLSYETAQIAAVKSREEAINWVITNQLGRRNLIPEDVSYLRGKRYEAEKLGPTKLWTRANERQRVGGQNDQESTTAQRLGKELGIGEVTVRRDAAFAAAVDKIGEKLGKDAADLIRTGRSGLTKGAIRTFAKESDITTEKFNELRFEKQQQKAKKNTERKKRAPKAPPLSQMKKFRAGLPDPAVIERMRQFRNALERVVESPVTAAGLAHDPWPPNWRKDLADLVPAAQTYLTLFAKEFSNGNQVEANDHNDAERPSVA